MIYLSTTSLFSLLLSIESLVNIHVAANPPKLPKRFPNPSAVTTQSYITPQIPFNPISCKSQNITSASAALESFPNYCLVGRTQTGCLTTKTWDGAPIPAITEQCVLWDNSCPGNKCSAVHGFFSDTLWKMTEKPCWKYMDNSSIPCSQYEPTSILSAMRSAKSWMRTPQCSSIGIALDAIPEEGSCCGTSYIHAENVDVYYWPEADADTACLDIVGSSVNPPEQGATTTMGLTYWGCTAVSPKTSTSISDIIGPSGNVVSSVTVTLTLSIITTAQMTSIGSISFKQSLFNPWSPPACVGETSRPPRSTPTGQVHGSQAFIYARGHSLVMNSSVTKQDGRPVSTVVSGTFTL